MPRAEISTPDYIKVTSTDDGITLDAPIIIKTKKKNAKLEEIDNSLNTLAKQLSQVTENKKRKKINSFVVKDPAEESDKESALNKLVSEIEHLTNTKKNIVSESDQPIEITGFAFNTVAFEDNDDWIAAGINSEDIFKVRPYDKNHNEIKFTTIDAKTKKPVPVQFAIKKTEIDIFRVKKSTIDKHMRQLDTENNIINILNNTNNKLFIDSPENGVPHVYQLLVFSGSYPYTEMPKDIVKATDTEEVKQEKLENADVAKKSQVDLSPEIKKMNLEERINYLWEICLNLNYLHSIKNKKNKKNNQDIIKPPIIHGNLNKGQSYLVSKKGGALTGFISGEIILDVSNNDKILEKIREEFFNFLTLARVILGCEYAFIEKSNIASRINTSHDELVQFLRDSAAKNDIETHTAIHSNKLRRIRTITELAEGKYIGFFENINQKKYPINIKQYFLDFFSTIDKVVSNGIDLARIKITTDTFLRFITIVKNFLEFYKTSPNDTNGIAAYSAKLALMSSGVWDEYDNITTSKHHLIDFLTRPNKDKEKENKKISKLEGKGEIIEEVDQKNANSQGYISDIPIQYFDNISLEAFPHICCLINDLHRKKLLKLEIVKKIFEIDPLFLKVLEVLIEKRIFDSLYEMINKIRTRRRDIFNILCKVLFMLDGEKLLTPENIKELDKVINSITDLHDKTDLNNNSGKRVDLNLSNLLADLQRESLISQEIVNKFKIVQEQNAEDSFETILENYPKFHDVIVTLLKNNLFSSLFGRIDKIRKNHPHLFNFFCNTFLSLANDNVLIPENISEIELFLDFININARGPINLNELNKCLKLRLLLKKQPFFDQLAHVDFFGKHPENFVSVLIKLYEQNLPSLDDEVINCLKHNEELCKKLLPIDDPQVIFLFANEIAASGIKEKVEEKREKLSQAQANFINLLDPTNEIKNKLVLLDSIHRHEFILTAHFGVTVYNKICKQIAIKILALSPRTSYKTDFLSTVVNFFGIGYTGFNFTADTKQVAANKLYKSLITGNFKSLTYKDRAALRQKEFKGPAAEVLKYVKSRETSQFYKQTRDDNKQTVVYLAKMALSRSGIWYEYEEDIKKEKQKGAEYNTKEDEGEIKHSKLEERDDVDIKMIPQSMNDIDFEAVPNICSLINRLYDQNILNLTIVKKLFTITKDKKFLFEEILEQYPLFHNVVEILLKNNLYHAFFNTIYEIPIKRRYLFKRFCRIFLELEKNGLLKEENISELQVCFNSIIDGNNLSICDIRNRLKLMILLRDQPIYKKLNQVDFFGNKFVNFFTVLIKLYVHNSYAVDDHVIDCLKANDELCKKLINIDDPQVVFLFAHEIALEELNKDERKLIDACQEKCAEDRDEQIALNVAIVRINTRVKEIRERLFQAQAHFIDNLDPIDKPGIKNKLALLDSIHLHQHILKKQFGEKIYDKFCEYIFAKIAPQFAPKESELLGIPPKTIKKYEDDWLSKVVKYLGIGKLGFELHFTEETKKMAAAKFYKAGVSGDFKSLNREVRAALKQKEFKDTSAKEVLEHADLETRGFGK